MEDKMDNILKYLQGFKNKMNAANSATNEKLVNLDSRLETLKLGNSEKEKRDNERFQKMENHLSKIEEAAKRSEYMSIKSNKLRQIVHNMDDQPAGSKTPDIIQKEMAEDTSTAETDIDSLLLTGSSFTSSWAQEVEEREKQEEVSARLAKQKELARQKEYSNLID